MKLVLRYSNSCDYKHIGEMRMDMRVGFLITQNVRSTIIYSESQQE